MHQGALKEREDNALLTKVLLMAVHPSSILHVSKNKQRKNMSSLLEQIAVVDANISEIS